MKKLLLPLLLLFAFTANAQISKKQMFYLLSQASAASPYVEIPDAPFTSGYNRAQTGLGIAGQLRPTDVGSPAGDLDIVFTSNFTDGLSLRDFGTNKFRITNSAQWTVGSGSTKAIGSILINNDIEFHGKDANTPLYFEGLGAGISSINWITSVAGPELKVSNVVATAEFAGLLASTATDKYKKFDIQFFRVFGTATEGEVIYIGNTGTTFAVTDTVLVEHVFGTDKGRDGLQLGHVTYFNVSKYTVYDVGKTNTAQQDHAVQIVDSNGIVEYAVFDTAPRIANISAHGITFRHCYFKFTDAAEVPGFIGRTDNLTYYPTARHNGVKILFDECYFEDASGSSSGAIFNVQERIADVEFLNCTFETTKSSLFQDTRVAGYSNTLIGTLTTNGNTTSSAAGTLTAPTYMSTTKTDYATHGFITTQWFIDRKMGYGMID